MQATPSILSLDKILLDARPPTKDAAITMVGQMLVDAGHVAADYIPAMFAREAVATTYLGNGVAVPHGTREGLAFVRYSGVAIMNVPGGVDFGGGNIAYLVVGLAAKGDDHLGILTNLAEICSDDAQLSRLLRARAPEEVLAILQASLQS